MTDLWYWYSTLYSRGEVKSKPDITSRKSMLEHGIIVTDRGMFLKDAEEVVRAQADRVKEMLDKAIELANKYKGKQMTKSKAQEFVELIQPKVTTVYRPSIKINDGVLFVVSDVGECLLANTSIVFSSQEALALRDWLTDTFDTPKIPGSKQPGWSRED